MLVAGTESHRKEHLPETLGPIRLSQITQTPSSVPRCSSVVYPFLMVLKAQKPMKK